MARYWFITSAVRPHASQSTKVVSSRSWPSRVRYRRFTAIPIAATAMLPLVLFPTIGVLDMPATAARYANDIVFLSMGGFLIAVAMVFGSSTVVLFTNGADPLAWNPIIRGSFRLRPAWWYSWHPIQ